jgi:hypothetical protein
VKDFKNPLDEVLKRSQKDSKFTRLSHQKKVPPSVLRKLKGSMKRGKKDAPGV